MNYKDLKDVTKATDKNNGAYQRKLLTVLYSGGSNPLEIWDIQVKNGWTRRVKDEDMSTIVFEVCGTNVATAYIVSPPNPRGVLGISLPFITMLIKNLKRYFTFEIQILDDKRMRRRFRFSNYQSSTKVRPFTCSVPLALKPGWNQMQLNLANFTMRAYGTNYMETQRIQIHANCRIRRIYFSDRLYAEEELPRDYRIYLNVRQAPRPPAAESQEQVPGEPLRAEPSSILRAPSKTEGTVATVVSEVEVADTEFKSTASITDRESVRASSSVAHRSNQSTTTKQWSRSVVGSERTSKGSLSRVSQQNVTETGEVTAEVDIHAITEEVPQEEELGKEVNVDQHPEEVASEQPEDVVEHEEGVEIQDVRVEEEPGEGERGEGERGEGERGEGERGEGERDKVVEEAVVVSVEPEESPEAESPSPRSEPTESDYAESEPIPESDLELEDSEPPTD